MPATAQKYLEAARVPTSLQPQEFGLWAIRRVDSAQFLESPKARAVFTSYVGWGTQTVLHHMTEATMHKPPHGWDIVMEDSVFELCKHLPIWMHGRGRVLVTGLGLGCVVRGLLASPDVDQIDVIELDKNILRTVGAEFAGQRRVKLIHADALTYQFPEGTRHDFAWHDLWCEGNGLQFMHVRLLLKYRDVPRQGAWGFPKQIKRRIPRHRRLG